MNIQVHETPGPRGMMQPRRRTQGDAARGGLICAILREELWTLRNHEGNLNRANRREASERLRIAERHLTCPNRKRSLNPTRPREEGMARKVRAVHKIPIGLTKPREEGMNPAKPGSMGPQSALARPALARPALARPAPARPASLDQAGARRPTTRLSAANT